MEMTPATAAKLLHIAKIARQASITMAISSALGLAVLAFMVYRDATPEGQMNVRHRQETVQKLSDNQVALERLRFEREKWLAAQEKEEK